MDFDEKYDTEQRANETKSERRARRKKEMKQLLEYEASFKEEITTNGVFVMNRRMVQKSSVEKNEIALLQLLGKAKQRGYTDEEIGKEFRKIFDILSSSKR